LTDRREWAAVVAAALLFCAWGLLAAGPAVPSGYQGGALVVVDPGHGGPDPGAVGPDGSFEDAINLAVAQIVARDLAAGGIAVRLTRTRDTSVTGRGAAEDLVGRARYANSLGAAVLVSIHVNAEPTGTVAGPIVYYRPGSALGLLLAQKLEAALARAALPSHPPRAAPHRLLELANMPAVTVEIGFLTNAGDRARLQTAAWQIRIADAVASGVLAYLDQRGPA
jgi:N-acetylmuramoyl-L-alanine amidase